MKQIKTSILLFAAAFSLSLVSCSKDEDEFGNKKEDNVSVKDDGTISGNHVFSAIDDKNFFIDYVKYTVVNGHLEVSGYDEAGLKGEVKIVPSLNYKGNNYQVLAIGEKAFEDCDKLKSISIPNSVTSIDYAAFYGSALTSITIPSSVTEIESYTFGDCASLTSVTISNSVTEIGHYAFRGCSGLASITIPNSVKEIGSWSFMDCTSLTSVTIGNSVEDIEELAFSGCKNLTSIVIDKSNPNYSSDDGIVFDKDKKKLILYPAGKKGAYTIPNSVEVIDQDAFRECSGLTSVTIPNSVKEIHSGAFAYCSGLTSVVIPNSVVWVGSVFTGCSSLTSVTLPDSMEQICDWTFYECSNLTSVVIPKAVKKIGENAFNGCSSLNEVTIPNYVEEIGRYAFDGCSKLSSVTCLATTPPHIWYSFSYSSKTLHVLPGCGSMYRDGWWSDYFDNIVEDAKE